jgi:hypothetical protein
MVLLISNHVGKLVHLYSLFIQKSLANMQVLHKYIYLKIDATSFRGCQFRAVSLSKSFVNIVEYNAIFQQD